MKNIYTNDILPFSTLKWQEENENTVDTEIPSPSRQKLEINHT